MKTTTLPAITAKTIRLARLADFIGLTPAQAVALPVTVEVMARKLGTSEEMVFSYLEQIRELRDEAKRVCVLTTTAA